MTKHKYNIWLALSYEIINALCEHYKTLKQNKIVKLILENCKHDWILWKVETTLIEVDRDIDSIVKTWEAQEPPKFIYTEQPPDGSLAQSLLGGEMEIRGNFRRE
jgi:hypothetical protein